MAEAIDPLNKRRTVLSTLKATVRFFCSLSIHPRKSKLDIQFDFRIVRSRLRTLFRIALFNVTDHLFHSIQKLAEILFVKKDLMLLECNRRPRLWLYLLTLGYRQEKIVFQVSLYIQIVNPFPSLDGLGV